ncbi:MAG: hypothetical protein JNM14_13010 [Ferruginibacter sp.]|nr:hypothetical protein [Ferruginibacter sp.]
MSDQADYDVKGWVPYKLVATGENVQCRWLYAGNKDFTEPFFDETILACRMLPENGFLHKKINTGIDELTDKVKEAETIEPTAFIFHISRCGSTLLSQMLGLQPANIVLSEVPFFDNLLRYGKKHDCMAKILPQLKAAIGIYGTKRKEAHQHLFIKTDSWHIHFYKELRILYPTAPFFLLYRKPDEVLRSQQKKRGMQSLPDIVEPEIFGFEKNAGNITDLDKYMSKVLESYFQAFDDILQKDKLAFALNYHDGAMQMIETIVSVTGIPINETEKAAMQHRAGFHAKFPDQVFSEEKPEAPVPDSLKRSAELYDKIEALRSAKK